MRKRAIILVILLFAIARTGMAQKMTVKDSDAHVLMEVNDEGDVGSITLPEGSAPSTTTNKLYNVSGDLWWNGSQLSLVGSAGGWTDGGANVYLTTSTDKVGIGITTPAYPLDVDSTIGMNNIQILYLPNQSKFTGTLYLGDGGGSLSHSSGSEGRYNTAVGIGALDANITGYQNTASGYQALVTNTAGNNNTAIGMYSLLSNTTGNNNIAIGYSANHYNQTGSNNTIIGYEAGRGTAVHDKSGNVFIGYQAGYNENGDNKLYIENSNSSPPLIGGDFDDDELYFNGDVGIRKTSPGAALDVDGRIHAAAHAADKGLRLPTNAGPPSSVTGTSEGDIVWDSSNDNLYVYNGSSFSHIVSGTSLWESGTNGVYEDDAAVIVGIDQAETLENSGFSLAAGDLFIQDQLGVEGNVYTDGSFVAGSSLTLADGSITQSAGSALSVTLGEGSGDDFIVDTSTLVVESDNDRVGIGDTSPTHTLDVAGKVGINDTQVLFLPNQSNFPGTLILGDGGGTLSHSVDSTGWNNTAVGIDALNANTEGYQNTATGRKALCSNTTGNFNTASGYGALRANTTGSQNTASGNGALLFNTTGSSNTATGHGALFINSTGYNNTATGTYALLLNTFGHSNTATGAYALYTNSTGYSNTANGDSALYSNTIGYDNTASGYKALWKNTEGNWNTATGHLALYANTTGDYNTAIGRSALSYNTTGENNTGCGRYALNSNIEGDNNTAIGCYADVSADDLTNATAIGYGASVNESNKVRIGNTFVTVIEGKVDFSFPSDSTKKENFLKVDGEHVLNEIRNFNLYSWNYKGDDPAKFRHYGPMGQEFFSAFGQDEMGTIGSDTTLCGSDVAGINMIAIQALEKRTRELQNRDPDFAEENEKLKTEIIQLKNLVDDLREDLQKLESRLASSERYGRNRDAITER